MTIEWKLRELLAKSMQRKSDKCKVTFTLVAMTSPYIHVVKNI